MSTVEPSFSEQRHVLNNRVQRSMEGWSIIEKITDFTHAVCRVSDGSGSAILISLPPPEHTTCREGAKDGSKYSQHVGSEGMGVLLTTSFVFPSPEETQGATVTFLEQPVAGTGARQGRRVDPVRLPVCVDKVFVCSTCCSLPRAQTKEKDDQKNRPLNESQEVLDDNDCSSANNEYDNEYRDTLNQNEGEEELGYTLTLCDFNLHGDRSMTHFSPHGSFLSLRQYVLEQNDTNSSVNRLSPTFSPLANCGLSSPFDPQDIQSAAFVTSAGGNSSGGGRLSQNPWNSYPIKPLPLPLLLSRIAPVQVGDRHMMITHINGLDRHYVVQIVKYVGTDFCEYEFCDPASEFSSGGPIFDMQGDFVGLQHQCGDRSYGIFISSIVRHLFQSMVLGLCRLPIADVNRDETKFDMSAVVPDDVFNQPFHVNQQYCVLNVGAGDQIIEYEDFERLRFRNDIQGSTQPPSLVTPDSNSVWKEFYSDFDSIIRILHAFSHAPKLTKRALDEMTSRDYRQNLQKVASIGGIGIVLEIIDGYPQNEEVVLAALTVLAHASLYQLNLVAILRCDGVLTLLEIMNEYSHHASIQHWGFYCLYNVMAVDSPTHSEAIQLFAWSQGIDLAIEALRVHSGERHVLRHTGLALSCVASEDIRHVCTMVSGGIANILVERMKGYSDDAFVLFGLATLLRELLTCVMREVELLSSDSTSTPKKCLEKAALRGGSIRVAQVLFCSSGLGDGIGSALLDVLVKEKLLTVLCNVMSSESLNTYSSASVTLLENCISSVHLLLTCRIENLNEELALVGLDQICKRVMDNFPTEKALLQQAEKIMDKLSVPHQRKD